MHEIYPLENHIKFSPSNRTIHIDTKNALEAQQVKENLKDADDTAKRWPHRRPASINYSKRPESVKYSVNISDSVIDISGNDLGDIIAALDDIYNKNYITKTKRGELAQQIDAVEDTPERRSTIKAYIMQNIKSKQMQNQQQMTIGTGSQLLKSPKINPSAVSTSTNGHQNGTSQTTNTKPPIK